MLDGPQWDLGWIIVYVFSFLKDGEYASREYASQKNVNGPPMQLDMFPLAPFLPPGEKTLRRISIFLPSLTLNYTNRSSPA